MVAIERTAVADVSGWRFGTRGRDRDAIASSAFGAAAFTEWAAPALPPTGPFGSVLPRAGGEAVVYSAGTIGVEARSSNRRSTGRRMAAIKRRNSRCTAPGGRKCEANSRLISTGRQ